MALKTIRFLAVWLVAIILAPSMAHFFELPGKMKLAEQEYFVVQQIYRGWALFGFVIFPAILLTLALAVKLRHNRKAFLLSLTALLCLLAGQALFWTYTFPANQQTSNWTTMPANWLDLRTQWEYSHAVAAILNLTAFTLLLLCTGTEHSPRSNQASHF